MGRHRITIFLPAVSQKQHPLRYFIQMSHMCCTFSSIQPLREVNLTRNIYKLHRVCSTFRCCYLLQDVYVFKPAPRVHHQQQTLLVGKKVTGGSTGSQPRLEYPCTPIGKVYIKLRCRKQNASVSKCPTFCFGSRKRLRAAEKAPWVA